MSIISSGDWAPIAPTYTWPLRCAPEITGCASGLEIRSDKIPHEHELVHGVLHRGGGGSFLLVEGVAVALSGAFAVDGDPFAVGPEELLQGPGDASLVDAYAGAGRFVRHLIDTYGLDRVITMLLRSVESPELPDAIISEVVSEPWEDITSAYRESAGCPGYQIHAWISECGAPEINPSQGSQGSWTFAEVISCTDSDDAVGSADTYWVAFTIEVPSPGDHRLTLVGDPGVSSYIVSCGGCASPLQVWLEGHGAEQDVTLEQGKYSVRIVGAGEDPLNALLRIRPIAPSTPITP